MLKVINIGIWLDCKHKLNNNGAANYYDSAYQIFKENTFGNVNIKFISSKKIFDIDIIIFDPAYAIIIHKLFSFISKKSINFKHLTFISGYLLKIYKFLISPLTNQIDIIYYVTPTDEIIPDIPFIYTLWDLGHLSTYPFPELSMYNSFEFRKFFYQDNLYKALMIFVESQEGKNQLINYFNVFADKIYILPMIPSNIVLDDIIPEPPKISINKKNYIHYPAHFWSHKNHYNLILAFNIIFQKHQNIKLVLSGLDKGVKIKILNLINELDLINNIIIVDNFTIQELKWIYLNSIALVYPSFLGPTNMPIIEAYELGCKIACSNLPGHFEQVGNFANYFDPKNPTDIANVILNLIKNPNSINPPILLKNKTKIVFSNKFQEAITNIKQIRKTW